MLKRLMMAAVLSAAALVIAFAGSAQEKKAPKGFGFNNPSQYREQTAVHSGTGIIRYVEEFGPGDFKTRHQFLRVGVIPPKSSIGEYRLTDSDELFMFTSGLVYVTMNGRTARLVGPSMVPARVGETIGIFNPSDTEVPFAWLATTLEKGKYNPVDLGNDLVKKRFEEPCQFTWIPMDYGGFRITIKSAHGGKGPIYDTFGRLSKEYYKTLWGAFYLILPPGTSIGYHRHDIHEELYYVVKGRARGTVDDVTLDLKAGDTILCPLGSSHGIYNNGAEDLGIICTLNSSLPSGEWGAENLGDDLTKR